MFNIFFPSLIKGGKASPKYLISPSGTRGFGLGLVFVLMAVAVRSHHYVNELSSPLRIGPGNVRGILKRSGVRAYMCVRESRFGRGTHWYVHTLTQGPSCFKRHINNLPLPLIITIRSPLIQTQTCA